MNGKVVLLAGGYNGSYLANVDSEGKVTVSIIGKKKASTTKAAYKVKGAASANATVVEVAVGKGKAA